MTGRELVNFIMDNHLEDEQVFDRAGHLIGFINEDDAAIKFGVGPSTIKAWVNMGVMEGFNVNGLVYIPASTEDPRLTGALK